MLRLDRIQRISGLLRQLVLLGAVLLGGAVVWALLVPGQGWLILGDGQLNALHRSGAISGALALAMAAPFAIILALGVYWLQRLFGQYRHGNFFTDDSMRCCVWLVWLKAAAFIYGIAWPLLLDGLSPVREVADLTVTVEAGTLVELAVLLLIVHLLKAAQQIHDENKAFV